MLPLSPRAADAAQPLQPGGPARRLAGSVVALMTTCAFGLAVLSLCRPRDDALAATLPWLFASGIGIAASTACWSLARQRSVEAAVRDARQEAHALADLLGAWQWRPMPPIG